MLETAKKRFTTLYEAFKNIRAVLASVRWAYFGVAFIMAVGLWYVLTVRDKVETWVDVRIEYRGLPHGLVVREGLVDKLSVRLRAALGLTRTITTRPYAVSLDLSAVQKGTTVLHITPEILPFTDAFEVLEISPSRIAIVADALELREVPMEAAVTGHLAKDFYVRSLRITPQNAHLRGPETLVSVLERVFVPIALTEAMRPGPLEMREFVNVPDGVTVTPQQVVVDLEVGVRTKTVRVTRDVRVAAEEGVAIESIQPAKVTVSVEVPESQANDEQVLEGIIATATLPGRFIAGGELNLPVHVILPEFASLDTVEPKEITVKMPAASAPPGTPQETPATPKISGIQSQQGDR